jgi:ATP/maltotriose-dependent transcriptional regulator MalT
VSRNTLHLLRWTAQTQRYTLTLGTQTLPSEITSGDEVWTQWLATVSSFAFEGRSGIHCTLRKERLQRGDTYWYAYRSMCGRTKKRYLGRTADLSFARLEEVSALFANEEQQSQPPAFPTQNEEQDIQHATSTAQHTEKDTRQTSVPSALPLLETKLHPPLLPVKLVKRTRLLEQLDASLTCKLTLLLAPAGSGKTTLVKQWLSIHLPNAKDKSPTNPVLAWLSLDAGDNDPLRFWRYLMTACLKLLVPEQQTSGQAALALLSPLNPSPFEPPALDLALTQLLNALASSPFEGLLVLDDYHAISDSRVHETLAFFIDYLPATIHVLLLSRSEPPLPLLRWRASAWYEQEALLTEAIEAAYLARDMERVARLIERVHEQNFSEPQTMLRWLEQLPEAVLREHPMLCFLFATELRFPVKLWFAQEAALAAEAASIPSVERGRIETLLSMAEEGWRRSGEVSWIGAIWAHRALSALLDEEPFSSVVHFARQALIFLPRKGALDRRVQMYRSSCLFFVGKEKLDLGQVDEARELLLQAEADNLPPGNRFLAVDILLTLGKIYLAQGALSLAQKYLRQALSDARELDDEKVIVEAQLELTRLEGRAETSWQVSPLSVQEERVLQGLCAGLSNQEIANTLIISINTVKYHVKHLYQKLGVSNRLQASEAARQLRLSSSAPRLLAEQQRNEPR